MLTNKKNRDEKSNRKILAVQTNLQLIYSVHKDKASTYDDVT